MLSCEESQAVSKVASVKDPSRTLLNLNISFSLVEIAPGGEAGDSSCDASPKTSQRPSFLFLLHFLLFLPFFMYSLFSREGEERLYLLLRFD